MTTSESTLSAPASGRRIPWSGWLLLAASLLLESCGQLCLKLGARSVPAGLSDLETIGEAATSVWAYGGYACIALQFPVWLGVLARLELSLAFPLSSLSQVTILLASVFILGERATFPQVAGIASIILGSFLILADGDTPAQPAESPAPAGADAAEACEGVEP